MSKLENFNPEDPQYKTVEDLPAEERPGFVNVEGGFVRQGTYDIKKAQEEAEKTGSQEQKKPEAAPTPRKETPLEFLRRARGEDLADRTPETLRLIDSLTGEEKIGALADARQKIAEALARSTQEIEEKRRALAATRKGLGIPEPESEGNTPSFALKLKRHEKLSSLQKEIEARKADTEKTERAAEGEKEEKNKEYIKTFRESLGPISENINRLNGILRKRESERLQPFMNERGIAQLSAASRALMELTNGNILRSEEVAGGISRVAAALDEYGNVRGRETLREDGESLRQVGFAIRELADSARAAQARIAQKGRDTPEYRAISQLSQTLDMTVNSHFRRVATFERYTGR